MREEQDSVSLDEQRWINDRPKRVWFPTQVAYESALHRWAMRCPEDVKHKGRFSR